MPGGFWKPCNRDHVRRLLLPMLPSWPEALDWDSIHAIDWFVDEGFFFVQAMKWTLKQQTYMRLTTRQKCLAIEHAVDTHLLQEIELIQPKAVIALGAGAWDACFLLAERYGQSDFAEARVTAARLRHHALGPTSREAMPLHVTFLPGTINEKVTPDRISAIADDVGVFFRCITTGGGCETSTRVRVPGGRRRQTVGGSEPQEWVTWLKAEGLWGRFPTMTPEERNDALARFKAARQQRSDDDGAR